MKIDKYLLALVVLSVVMIISIMVSILAVVIC